MHHRKHVFHKWGAGRYTIVRPEDSPTACPRKDSGKDFRACEWGAYSHSGYAPREEDE
jgi:hypothetical protein